MMMTLTKTRTLVAAAVVVAAVTACDAKQLDLTNPNSATVSGATNDPTAFQLLATGLMADQRGTRTGFITNASVLGRESYTFTPNEGRNVTHPLIGILVGGVQKLDPTGFAVGPWGGEYGAMRDLFNFKNTVAANPNLSAAQKAAATGFAQALEGLMIFEIVQTHDSLGGITEIKADPAAELAPFVPRDSMYKFVIGSFDAAIANLTTAGSTAFPFT